MPIEHSSRALLEATCARSVLSRCISIYQVFLQFFITANFSVAIACRDFATNYRSIYYEKKISLWNDTVRCLCNEALYGAGNRCFNSLRKCMTYLRVHLICSAKERSEKSEASWSLTRIFRREIFRFIYICIYGLYDFNWNIVRWNIITRNTFRFVKSNLYAGNKSVKIVASQSTHGNPRIKRITTTRTRLRINIRPGSNPKVKFCREGMIDLGTREKPFKLSRELGQTLNVHPRVLVRKEIEQILRSVIN